MSSGLPLCDTAVVLAGGKGTRLYPFTSDTPKPLVPLGDRPIIAYVLHTLKCSGVRKVTLAVNHLADKIEATLGDGRNLGIQIAYSREPKPLSTIGPLALIDGLPDHTLVVNGDTICAIDYQALYAAHLARGAALTIATHIREDRIDYGVLETDADGLVTGYREKPSLRLAVSMGIYVIARRALAYVPRHSPFGVDQLAQVLIEHGQPVLSYPYSGYWLDIGRPDDYARAIEERETIDRLLGLDSTP